MKVRLDDQEWHEFLANGSYKRVLFLAVAMGRDIGIKYAIWANEGGYGAENREHLEAPPDDFSIAVLTCN